MFETSTTSAFGLVLTTPQKPHIPIASYSLSEWLAGVLTSRGQKRSHAPNLTLALAALPYVGWRTAGGPSRKLFWDYDYGAPDDQIVRGFGKQHFEIVPDP